MRTQAFAPARGELAAFVASLDPVEVQLRRDLVRSPESSS